MTNDTNTKRMTKDEAELHMKIGRANAWGREVRLAALEDWQRARENEEALRTMLQRLCDAIGAEPGDNMTPEQTATFAVYMEAAQLLERSES